MNLFLYNELTTEYDEINTLDFRNEKELQDICEKNIENIFGLEMICSEFSIGKFRIDSFAFDPIQKSFVIIEYKNVKSFSVIDQGYTYLSLMLNNKSDFMLKYIEVLGEFINKNSIDWTQSKVIFVSPKFNTYQIESINFKDVPFELWEVAKFENKILTFNNITANASSDVSITSLDNLGEEQINVSKEIVRYSESDHLNRSNQEIKDIYEKFRDSLFLFGNHIKFKHNKRYIAISNNKILFCNFVLQQNQIRIILNLEFNELNDGLKLFKDKNKTGGYALGNYEAVIADDENFDYIVNCIKQSFEDSNSNGTKRIPKISRDLTEEDHLNVCNNSLREVYSDIKENILISYDNIDIRVARNYIAFSNSRKTFLSIVIGKKKIRLYLNKFSKLSDPRMLFRKVSRIGGYAAGNYDIDVFNNTNIEYILDMIKESHEEY